MKIHLCKSLEKSKVVRASVVTGGSEDRKNSKNIMKAGVPQTVVSSQNTRRSLIGSLAMLLVLILCGNTARATFITWTNHSAGNWSAAANWSPNLVPGSGDDVSITNYSVTLDISPTVAGLALAGGTLNGPGGLIVNGPFVWSGGLIVSAVTVTLNGTSTLDGTSMYLSGKLVNSGALTWSGSGNNLSFNANNGAGTITNLASGTITIAADVSCVSEGTIVNAGTITKTNTSGVTALSATLINTGTLSVQSGSVNVDNGGTQAGNVSVASGATLNFDGGTHTVVAGFSASGPGTFIISSATVDFNNPAGSALPSLMLVGGSGCYLGGTGSLAVNGPFVWSGGTIDNTGGVTLNGTSTLDGAAMILTGYGILINAGALTWSGSGGNLNFDGNSGAGTLTNLASGTITITADVSSVSGGTLVNEGLITKTNSTGTTTLDPNVVNTGTLDIESGTIDLNNASTQSGAVSVASGSTLNFDGGTHTVVAGFSASGPGTFIISSATVDFNNPAGSALPDLMLVGGSGCYLGGTGLLAVNGPFVWSGGSIVNTGGVTLNGTSTLDGAAMYLTGYGILINAGALTWSGSGGNLNFDGNNGAGTLTNLASGTITITSDVSSVSGGTLVNEGLITKTNTTGITTLDANVVNTGTLDIQSGTIDLDNVSTQSGAVSVASGATLNFDNGTHTVLSGFSATGPGSFKISGATVNFNSATGSAVPNLTLTDGTLGGSKPVAINGPFVWTNSTIANTGGVTLNGTSSLEGGMYLPGHLFNAGALTWSGSGNNLSFYNASGNFLTNLASGTITIIADVGTYNTGDGTIGNAGLIIKTNSTGTSPLNAVFVNTGTVQVQSGTVELGGGGTQSGIVSVASGATVDFDNGTHAVLAGFSASGPGSWIINGGEVDFNNAAGSAVPNLTLTGGTLGGSKSLAVNGPFVWSGSTGTIDNAGGVTLNGTSSLDGAAMYLSGRLINTGALTWSGSGTYNLDDTGTLTNLASGTITITTDVSADGGGTVGNAGSITKTNTTGTTILGANVVNTGVVQVQGGTIDLDDGGTQAGTVSVASGSTLNFDGGTHAVLAGFGASGPGSFIISGATVDFDNGAGSALPNLTLTGGVLGGSGPLAVNGPFVWSGNTGTIGNTGGVTLDGTSSLDGTTMYLTGRLINGGALTWSGTGTYNLDDTGTLTNLASGTIAITTDVSADGGGTVGNAGSITKTNTTGTTILNAVFVNTGILTVQSGTMSLASTYTLTKGTLDFGINGPTNYGRISLSTAPAFKCSLGVNLNGFYWPAIGSVFNLLKYPSETGVLFTNTALPPFITWQTNYTSTNFTLTVDARQTNNATTSLTMSLAGGNSLNLDWPGDHTGWQLEAQTNSTQTGIGSNWVVVPGSGLTNELTFPIDPANGSVFFRLSYP
jgi:hypothetical protein